DKYGIDTKLSNEDIAKLPQLEQDKYAQASKEFSEDERIRNVYSVLINLTIIITSISLLIAYVISDVVLPLILKNGQTVGKKVFNIALMRVDGVKVSTFQLFVRAVLGKFTIETMLPVLLVMMMFFGVMGGIALIVVLLLLVLQIVVMSISKTNSAMHDLLAVTVTVDLESQRIFESEAALMEYKHS
ncbi:MAG: RDD family protein, partial [Clostridia bacterium]|nr:RDD family protein [Clostridia bacterium]